MSVDGTSADHSQWRQTLDTATGPETLDRMQGCLTELWSEHPEISEDVRYGVTLAAFEICSNIIEHAGRGRPVRMRMKVRVRPADVDILFIDDGDAASVDLGGVVMPTEESDRGRGLAIAKAFLDELSYRRDHHENQWRLSQRLPTG